MSQYYSRKAGLIKRVRSRRRRAAKTAASWPARLAARGYTPPARRSAPKRTRSAGPGPAGTTLNVSALGTAIEIVYRDRHGQTWRHKFKGSAKLYRTHDGRELIIAPVQVQEFVI